MVRLGKMGLMDRWVLWEILGGGGRGGGGMGVRVFDGIRVGRVGQVGRSRCAGAAVDEPLDQRVGSLFLQLRGSGTRAGEQFKIASGGGKTLLNCLGRAAANFGVGGEFYFTPQFKVGEQTHQFGLFRIAVCYFGLFLAARKHDGSRVE